jgi:hypothetical protein
MPAYWEDARVPEGTLSSLAFPPTPQAGQLHIHLNFCNLLNKAKIKRRKENLFFSSKD